MTSRLLLLWALLISGSLRAETGSNAWLRYARLDDAALNRYQTAVPAVLTVARGSALAASAKHELLQGMRGMLGRTLRVEARIPDEAAIVLGTLAAISQVAPQFRLDGALGTDGYWLKTVAANGARYTVIAGGDDRGALYGAFALLRKICLGESIDNLDEKQSPYAPIRWVNQWDNLDGSIERGYGGRSIFWENRPSREDLSRVNEYGRLLASLGINGCAINNVNSDPQILGPELIPEAARIAGAFRPWGIRIALAVDFGSPKNLGGLDTFDPLDPRVVAWWQTRIDELYRAIPDLGGIVIKADSEGRVGPSAYGRTHADAANVVARALKPHGGLLFYRGFVYDHKMDWRNLKNDRAGAAWDSFVPLDGKFDDNVVIQIKNGPIDFQVREPASPLFGVVQMYIRDKVSSVTRPVKELKGFARVSLVPGQTTTVELDITPEHLSFYNVGMRYVVEPGEFEVMVGSSSRDEDLQRLLLRVRA